MTWLRARLKLILGAIAAIAVAIGLALVRKSGADAELAKQARAERQAADTIVRERTRAQGASAEEHQKGIDKWTRR